MGALAKNMIDLRVVVKILRWKIGQSTWSHKEAVKTWKDTWIHQK